MCRQVRVAAEAEGVQVCSFGGVQPKNPQTSGPYTLSLKPQNLYSIKGTPSTLFGILGLKNQLGLIS